MKKLYLAAFLIFELYPEKPTGRLLEIIKSQEDTFSDKGPFVSMDGEYYFINRDGLAARIPHSAYELYRVKSEEIMTDLVLCRYDANCFHYQPTILLAIQKDLHQIIPRLASVLKIDPDLLDRSMTSLKLLDDIFQTYYLNSFLAHDTYALLLGYCSLTSQYSLGSEWSVKVEIPQQDPEKHWRIYLACKTLSISYHNYLTNFFSDELSLFEGVQRFISYCTESLHTQINYVEGDDEILPFL
ncbi:hypothetical protein QNI16_27860 [Cytophagaceae bacterium YF14B1]|uniref:Uncharacterized protein n=1 Tax=Xanthocytophaga flava TaxID=3048013 RepID=A0AAE3QW22_9BACT|nr:hypothetical protein [Xanthocytophaga flavus]MDJ1484345.1 hypothetical protein [Xanthocytophaga flavus]